LLLVIRGVISFDLDNSFVRKKKGVAKIEIGLMVELKNFQDEPLGRNNRNKLKENEDLKNF